MLGFRFWKDATEGLGFGERRKGWKALGTVQRLCSILVAVCPLCRSVFDGLKGEKGRV
jgi:hypothetical protein